MTTKSKRTFEGLCLDWIVEITKDRPQRKIRGITIIDMLLLKRKLKQASK